MINAAYEIERLLKFARKNGLIEQLDEIFVRNQLLDLFKLEEPYNGLVPEENPEYPTGILDCLLSYAEENGFYDKEIKAYRELFDTKVMGLLMPRASEVSRRFEELSRTEGIEKATDYFYRLCLVSNYIRTAQISKNIGWKVDTEYGELEITINLSKPEKDPKQIALELSMPQKQYPKCLLCLENTGYAGRVNFPARQTHRVVPVTLSGEPWYLQYSPYVYYNEHCIVFSEEHRPMQVTRKTFERLLNFVEQFPHYTCGSNADLPIVGGSILSHDHFQGGRYTFPMEIAEIVLKASHSSYPGMKISTLRWPLSVIRASSSDVRSLVEFSDYVLKQWREYSDEKSELLAYTTVNGEKVPHNTITPIARRNRQGEYEIDLVLRNNRTTPEYPDGLFHPHKEMHHIKKENIGLIEVMGLAILPARLSVETGLIKDILTGSTPLNSVDSKDNVLYKHITWVRELIAKYGKKISGEQSEKVLQYEIGEKFKTCLEHSGVYKQTEKGQKAFTDFLKSMGCKIA